MRMIFKRNLLILLLGTAGLILTGNQCTSPTASKEDGGPDTTSHNFIWTIDTIGYRDTELHDAVIIDENNIWVVGEIYPDSASHKDAIIHGAIHWNGTKWEYKKIPVTTLSGKIGNFRATGVVKGNDNSIWTIAGSVHVFDGEKVLKSYWIHKFTGNLNPIFEEGQGPSKLFKTSDGKIYCYGRKGALAYFTGTNWIKIPTPTDLDIVDMHGDWNPRTGEYELIALASTDYSNVNGSKLLKITGQSVTELSVEGINNYYMNALWFTKGEGYWVSGNGVYHKKNLNELVWIRKLNFPNDNWNSGDINGWSKNDFFMTLSGNNFIHYNGSTWKDIGKELNLKSKKIQVHKIIIGKNQVVAVGVQYFVSGVFIKARGAILRGKRI